MKPSEVEPPQCEKEILEKGEFVAIITGANATVIECFVKEIARTTGEPVDWHYVGGRAVVLTTGDVQRVREAVDRGKMEIFYGYN